MFIVYIYLIYNMYINLSIHIHLLIYILIFIDTGLIAILHKAGYHSAAIIGETIPRDFDKTPYAGLVQLA
jgi:hypothetical protein